MQRDPLIVTIRSVYPARLISFYMYPCEDYIVQKPHCHNHHPKNLPNSAVPTVLASPPVPIALFAILDAWLNLSHLEKANVFVIVRTIAITA